ncbi:hypothetical protein FQR65_LT17669 [Abscondita terminalis]|nr:hypothetical protein FQR65_LT17669 [Abscondita terminalis]
MATPIVINAQEDINEAGTAPPAQQQYANAPFPPERRRRVLQRPTALVGIENLVQSNNNIAKALNNIAKAILQSGRRQFVTKNVHRYYMCRSPKKWKNIKDRFIKDHRMYSKSGSGACKRKKYVYYDILQFLVAQTERQNTESNVSQEARSPELNEDGQEEAEEFPQSLQGASNIQRPTAATSRSKNNFEKKLLDILESRQLPIAYNDENDDDLNFFKSLLPTLKTLDEQQKMEFRVQMMQSLQKIKNGLIRFHPITSFHHLFHIQVNANPIYSGIGATNFRCTNKSTK